MAYQPDWPGDDLGRDIQGREKEGRAARSFTETFAHRVPYAVKSLSSAGAFLSRDKLPWLSKVAVAACVGTVKPRGNNGSGKTHQAA